jgi:hypothetical protein
MMEKILDNNFALKMSDTAESDAKQRGSAVVVISDGASDE